MQRQNPTPASNPSPLDKINDQLTEGQTEETKPVTVIPWFFIALGIIAVVAMVLFLINNRH